MANHKLSMQSDPVPAGNTPAQADIDQFFAWVAANNVGDIRALSDIQLLPLMAARNAQGQTPLMVAAYEGCKDTADELVVRGASMSVEDPQGRSVLSYMEDFGAGISVQKGKRLMVECSILAAIRPDDPPQIIKKP